MFSIYKQKFAEIIHQHITSMDLAEIIQLIETPPANIPGDVAFPCFSLSKELRKGPPQIAQNLIEKIKEVREKETIFGSFEAIGPYLNAHIQTQHLATNVIPSILSEAGDYGKGKATGQTILVEGRSPNTHKMLHVGHLRNTLVSEAISSLYEFAGYTVIRSAYGGDIGAHVAKWIWYYKKFAQCTMPTDPNEFSIRSGEIYAEASAKAKEDPDTYNPQIHHTQKLLEDGDEELNKLRNETRDLSIQGLQNVFQELGSTIHKFYRESDVEQPGVELVKKIVDDPRIPAIKHSQGAIIADLEEFDLGVFVLLKSNGTSLYSTKDIALAYLKEEDYEFDLSLYVVATEQNHHFKQLFKTLQLIGYDTNKLIHMGYELVELPSGKMSSRDGTIIPYHTRRDDAIKQAYQLLEERELEDKETVARKVAFAALKFSMLLQDTYKKIRLDMSKSLSFEGETGPYLQYTYARIASLLRKHPLPSDYNTQGLGTVAEHELLLTLSQFSQAIQQAVIDRKPSIIARYTLELCRQFNSYYSTTVILSENNTTTESRLWLVSATQQVLKNGLTLLGIETLEKM